MFGTIISLSNEREVKDMKTLRLYYRNGNTLDIKAYDYEVTKDYLNYTTKTGCEMPHLACAKLSNIERIEEL